jgi:GNAT superfamily N-acetyltransferase
MDFFDHRAFSDHKEWKTCYCTYFFYPKLASGKEIGSSKRAYAKWLIERKKMNGYLVYEKGAVIGWCNVGPRRDFPRLKEKQNTSDGIKSIVCFIIEERYRGRGIATAMLKRIIKDSRQDGTKIIEAYPNIKAKNQFSHYHGPLQMYLKEGFEIVKRGNRSEVKLMISTGVGPKKTAVKPSSVASET